MQDSEKQKEAWEKRLGEVEWELQKLRDEKMNIEYALGDLI